MGGRRNDNQRIPLSGDGTSSVSAATSVDNPAYLNCLRIDSGNFLDSCCWDGPTVLDRLRDSTHVENGKHVPDFPYLRGAKIGPLWLRMLRDNVGLSIQNLERVPIPVDVHIARASLALGIVRGRYEGEFEPIYDQIRRAWTEGVKGLSVCHRPMIALDVDRPLWRLSKFGCTDRDLETGRCKHHALCPAREDCVSGKVAVGQNRITFET